MKIGLELVFLINLALRDYNEESLNNVEKNMNNLNKQNKLHNINSQLNIQKIDLQHANK